MRRVEDEAGGTAGRGTVRAVSRAVAVLRAFRQGQPNLALAEVAAGAQLDRATARRMLLTLMEEGLVRQDPISQRYALTLRVLELAAAVPTGGLREEARPVMQRAARRTRAEAMELLERVGMADRAHLLAEALSYGEQRRIEIARALGSRPKLLLLDEPTAGMNANESAVIGRLLHELRDAGLTVLMVEHNIRLVSDFCDHVAVVSFGRKLTEGTPADCLAHPDVQEAYFGRKRTPAQEAAPETMPEGGNDAERLRAHG